MKEKVESEDGLPFLPQRINYKFNEDSFSKSDDL